MKAMDLVESSAGSLRARIGSCRWRRTRGILRGCLAGGLAAVMVGCMVPVEQPGHKSRQEIERDQAEARRDLGIDYLSKGRNAMALRELQFSSEMNPADPKTWLWLGEGYRRRGHLEEALEYMKRAIELQPEYQAAHLNLSALYLELERYEDSLVHSQYLIDDPFYSQPWRAASNKGFALFRLGRIEDARESLEEALDFRRNYWQAALNLGVLEQEKGDQRRAIGLFETVLEQWDGFSPGSEANFRLAQLYVSMGHRAKAITYFEASVEDDPEGSWAEKSEDYLEVLR